MFESASSRWCCSRRLAGLAPRAFDKECIMVMVTKCDFEMKSSKRRGCFFTVEGRTGDFAPISSRATLRVS